MEKRDGVRDVFIVAGEPSGDALGAGLMAGLRGRMPGVRFRGVGGPLMAAEGLRTLFPMDELSVMGIAEVLPRYRALHRRMAQTSKAVLAARPDVLVTVDSPDFCLRVAARAHAAGIRTVHYVAPSVWAWRPGRAARMARHVDQVLALLPFEPPLMRAAGMRCDFVGHPVAAAPQATPQDAAAFREAHGIGTAPLLLVLPGSRGTETARLLPVFGAAVRRLSERRPDLRVVIPAAAPVAEAVVSTVSDWGGAPVILDPRAGDMPPNAKRAAFAAADVALAASGTVSLELAAAGTPMAVAYDMSWLSWQVMSRMALIDTVTLVNIVDGSRTVPEFLGPRCRPEPIADALDALLEDPCRQTDALARTMTALGRGGPPPGDAAAAAVLDGLASRDGATLL